MLEVSEVLSLLSAVHTHFMHGGEIEFKKEKELIHGWAVHVKMVIILLDDCVTTRLQK